MTVLDAYLAMSLHWALAGLDIEGLFTVGGGSMVFERFDAKEAGHLGHASHQPVQW